MKTNEFALICKALSNEARLKILMMLCNPKKSFPDALVNEKIEGVCLSIITRKIGLSQSTVSAYMTQLERAGLIYSTRDGQWTLYRINKAMPKKISEFLLTKMH